MHPSKIDADFQDNRDSAGSVAQTTENAARQPFGLRFQADVEINNAGGTTTSATVCYPEGTAPLRF